MRQSVQYFVEICEFTICGLIIQICGFEICGRSPRIFGFAIFDWRFAICGVCLTASGFLTPFLLNCLLACTCTQNHELFMNYLSQKINLIAGVRIRIHLIRIRIQIRIQHFMLNTGPNPGSFRPKAYTNLQLKKKKCFWIKKLLFTYP